MGALVLLVIAAALIFISGIMRKQQRELVYANRNTGIPKSSLEASLETRRNGREMRYNDHGCNEG